jgi:isopenicillin-N epimerase
MNTVTLTSLREEFLLDPSIIYLNHGSFGATPRPVFESYQRWQRELENQPCLYFRKVHELLEHSRTILANFLGTTCTNLAYVTNATTGINIVAHSMKLKPGDEVLSTDHEYGALDRTWQFLSKKQGFKYVNQPIPLPVASSEDVIGELRKGVTNRTHHLPQSCHLSHSIDFSHSRNMQESPRTGNYDRDRWSACSRAGAAKPG